MIRALLVAAGALLCVACASRPPRVTAPLREDPAPAAPDDPQRAAEPSPWPELPLPRFEPVAFTLANGLRVVVVERRGHGMVAASLAFARDVVDVGDLGGVRLALLPWVYYRASDESDTASASCNENGCVFRARDEGDDIDEVLGRMAQLVLRPKGSRDELSRRLAVALAARREGYGAAVPNNVAELLFRGTYHGLHDPRVPDVALDELDRVREQVIAPAVATLVIAGEVSPDAARAAAEATFGAWNPRPPPLAPRDRRFPPLGGGPHVVLIPQATKQLKGFIVARGPVPGGPDEYAVRVVASALGSGTGSRAFTQVREEQGAAYQVGAQLTQFRDGGAVILGGSFEIDKSITGMSSLLEAVRALRNEDLSYDALQKAKTHAVAAWRATVATDAGLADLLAGLALAAEPLDPNAIPRGIAAVTAADVRQAARSWLGEAQLRVLLLGNVRYILPDLNDLRLKDYSMRDNYARALY